MPIDPSKKKRLLINLDHDLGLFVEGMAELTRRSQSGFIVELLCDRLEALGPKEAAKLIAFLSKKKAESPDQAAACDELLEVLQGMEK